MNEEFRTLRTLVETKEREAKDARSKLDWAVNGCRHDFADSKYDPIIHLGCYSEGDRVGTMGVDWRGPSSWPERREPRWSRECKICGRVEYTRQSEEDPSARRPKF